MYLNNIHQLNIFIIYNVHEEEFINKDINRIKTYFIHMMDKRYWIKQYGRFVQAPEEISDLKFIGKAKRDSIITGEVPLIIEEIYDGGHTFTYKPTANAAPAVGKHIHVISTELSDADRSRMVDSMFNKYNRELDRLRKKTKASSPKRKKRKV